MSVAFNAQCLQCHMGKALKTAEALGDEAKTMAFARAMMKLYLSAPEDVGSPWFGPATADLLRLIKMTLRLRRPTICSTMVLFASEQA